MALRDINAEKQALSSFGNSYGKMPETDSEWQVLHRMAYPTKESLPDEFRNENTDALYASSEADLARNMARGGQPIQNVSVVPQPIQPMTVEQMNVKNQEDLTKATTDRSVAVQQAQDFNSRSGNFFSTIQKAIKMDKGSEQAGTGESELFKKAGLTGFENLSQSLNMRKNEIQSNTNYLTDTLTQLGDIYKTKAANVKLAYDDSVGRFEAANTALQNSMRDMAENKAAIDRINLQHKLDMENSLYESKLKGEYPTITEQNAVIGAGNIIRDGTVMEGTDLNRGIVGGFDISTYATDQNHEKNVVSIMEGIGKFNTLDDVTAYIQRKYPDSPITAEMVSKTSEKYGIPWEMLVAMMEQDSSLASPSINYKGEVSPEGPRQLGYRLMNPGNVGTTNELAAKGTGRKYASWQSGVDAVGKWLDKHRSATPATSETNDVYQVKRLVDLVGSGANTYITKDMAGSFKKGITEAFNRGGWPDAFNFAKTVFYNRMGATEKAKLVDSEVSKMSFGQAQTMLDKPDVPEELKIGPWNNISEKKLKPWLGMTKNQATAELKQFIEYGQAKLRNTLFGSQLTVGEMELSKNFIVDLEKDDLPTIRMKLDNLVWLSQNYEDIVVGRQLGLKAEEIPVINNMPHALYSEPKGSGVLGVEPTVADNDYVKSLGL